MSHKRDGHIYLIGFMGSGKSTVGPLLARELELPFADLDSVIEAHEGRSIREIFAAEGEAYFRSREGRSLGTLIVKRRRVIALGGGAFQDEKNRRKICESGTTVWLKASLALVESRSLSDPERPLAKDGARFRRLYEKRREVYELADIHVDTDGKTPSEICRELVDRLGVAGETKPPPNAE